MNNRTTEKQIRIQNDYQTVSFRRWLALRRCESPLRLGASRRVPSQIGCLGGRIVRTLVAVYALQAAASRPAVPSRVRGLAWGIYLRRLRYHNFLSERNGSEDRVHNRFREFVHLRCRPLIVAIGTAGGKRRPPLPVQIVWV